jgi:hypothetical protein
MTFDDDFARLRLSVGTTTIALKKLGLEWPPPERLWVDGNGAREATPDDEPSEVLHRLRISAITDEARAEMTHVARGCEYAYADDVSGWGR